MFGHQDTTDPTNQANQPQHAAPTADPQADGTLAATDAAVPATSAPAIDEHAASDYIVTDTPQASASSALPAGTPVATAPVGTDDLLDLKQDALQQLTPLLGHLDQTPEEKFRTTMMMIQASDNQSLLKTAYEAAQAITDEKTRAQALLDVVNEINYFTQAAQEQTPDQPEA